MTDHEPAHVEGWKRAILSHLKQWTSNLDRMAVVERDGTAVGYCFWMRVDATAVLASIYVAPASRRRGLGRALLKQFVADATMNGCTRLVANVEPGNAAKLLYEAEGFRRVPSQPLGGESEGRYLDYEFVTESSIDA